uniref:Uncharacterized protein n=1 Tax=Rhizophora mucronata TaxID=61149 RepID=A0A2P2J3F3_RHIMU
MNMESSLKHSSLKEGKVAQKSSGSRVTTELTHQSSYQKQHMETQRSNITTRNE